MASRKDSRGRVLKTGELQRKTKNANGEESIFYEYRYKDPVSDKRVSIYRNTLQELRDEEKKIQRMLDEQMDTLQGNRLLEDQLDLYLKTKLNLRTGSKKTYETAIKTLKETPIAKRKLRQITTTQIKLVCIDWHTEGRSREYIQLCYTILRSALQMGYEDGYIAKNPCSFKLGSILPQDKSYRMPLTKQEKDNLLEMLAESTNPYDEFYYHVVLVLCETGLRIGEFRGLRAGDIDFEERVINVHHQLTREGEYTPPKTKNAIRQIPMTQNVYISMKYFLNRAEKIRGKKQISYAGYDDFVMLSERNGQPVSGYTYVRTFTRFENEYKSRYGEDIVVTPHICRHTFCSNCAAGGMPPKSLQNLMGHASIQISMDVYSDLEFTTVKADFARVEESL